MILHQRALLPPLPGRVALLLATLLAGSAGRADSTVVFNEIMYHPSVAEPSMEWIELYNQMAVNMDLSGWSLAGGVGFRFPEGTVVPGGGHLVVAINPAALIAASGATNVIGPFIGRLSNSGETLELRNNNQRLMDAVQYGTDGDWPVAADGAGVSLAKRRPNLASAPAENWRMSAQTGGTPGGANFPTSITVPPVPLVTAGQSWRLDNTGTDLGTGWREPAFEDGHWSAGPTPFHGGTAPIPGGVVQPIPTLFNTGVDGDGHVLAPGSNDPHYTVTASAEPVSPPPPAPALVIEGHPAWLANDQTSSWLGPVNPGTVNVAAGNYRCRTTFSLTGFDPTSAVLTLNIAADNRLNDVLLNGVARGFNFAGFSTFSPAFPLAGGFAAGTNTLEFLWANDTSSPNPAGFRAQLSGTARTVSAPESALTPVRPTTYFRTRFVFNGNPAVTRLTLRAQANDGAVFYLNGSEILRLNLAPGPVTFSTPASRALGAPPDAVTAVLPAGPLHPGTNVLAVELHQAADGLNDAWFATEMTAGPVPVVTDPDLVFNEVAAGNSADFFLELANITAREIPLDGFSLERRGKTTVSSGFPPGSSIPSGGFRAFGAGELGWVASAGDRLVLFAPGGDSVADAVIVRTVLQGRFPDATGRWLAPATATPGVANSFTFQHDVVINEIQYHPRDGTASPGPWVELFNRGAVDVDLTGWRFSAGIDYGFAAGTVIPAGGYLVVAQDPGSMRASHPGIVVVGPFAKNLSHHGDRLVLADAVGNPADEVRYFDGGRWPVAADGGGSSLELRDPWADHSAAEAWAASRESGASGWSNYTYRAIAVASPGPTLWREFVVGLLDAGECLIDDLRVVESPAGTPVPLLQNGTFASGASAWRFLGTHRHSAVIPDPDKAANQVLHLVATGPTEHMHNHLETTLANSRAVVNGREYEVSFRAKWLAGNNQLNTRLYFNRVARTTVLAVPSGGGTPGARNSNYITNAGPTFSRFSHSPPVPAANHPVTVSVAVADPHGVTAVRVFWSANGGAWQDAAMVASAGGPSGGSYTGEIPGGAAGSVVQFYVRATDGLGAVATFPAAGPAARALYQVDDQRARPGALHNLRLIMTAADSVFLHAPTNVMSNENLGGTVVDGEDEVFYDIGVHLQASERGRNDPSRVGFTISFPPDHLFRGIHDGITVDRSGGYSGVGGRQDEIVLKHALQHAGGLPGMYDDLVRILPPRTDLTGPGLLILAKYGDVFLDSQYANGAAGSEFKLELVYYPTTTAGGNVQGVKLPQPDDVVGVDIGNLGNDPEVYRWFFLQDNNRTRNDYSPVIALGKALSGTGAVQDADAHRLMDVDMWMRAVAFQSLWGLVDTYPFDNPHNFILYFRPEDGRALPFLWDMDLDFGAVPTAPLNRATGNLGRLINLPGNQRLYLGHLLDLITTTYNTPYLDPWIAHFGSLAGENFTGIHNYVDQRVKSVRGQLPATVPFSITSNGGQDYLVDTTNTVVSGRAWINVRQIMLEGRPEPLQFKWTTTTAWQTAVPLMLGTNRLNFVAYDFQGQPLASNAVTVTCTAFGGGLDTDGDGLPDAWESVHGLDPAVPDADADPDGDGQTNRQEYLAGTDPRDPASVLKLEAHASGDGVRLAFVARAGRSYSIVGQDQVGGVGWQRVFDAAPQIGDHRVEAIELGGPLRTARFYRVVTPRMP